MTKRKNPPRATSARASLKKKPALPQHHIDVYKRQTIRRTDQKIGIIILSAKGQEQDKIRGLSIGADDYMTKPFSVSEPVSYTHLDVYKRQLLRSPIICAATTPRSPASVPASRPAISSPAR